MLTRRISEFILHENIFTHGSGTDKEVVNLKNVEKHYYNANQQGPAKENQN